MPSNCGFQKYPFCQSHQHSIVSDSHWMGTGAALLMHSQLVWGHTRHCDAPTYLICPLLVNILCPIRLFEFSPNPL